MVRTGDVGQSLKVHYTTHDGSAKAGQHFQPRSGEIIFAPNSNTAIVSIPIIEDEALTQAQRNFEFRVIEDFETGAHEDETIVGGDGDDVITDEGNSISKILAGELGDDAIREVMAMTCCGVTVTAAILVAPSGVMTFSMVAGEMTVLVVKPEMIFS